MEHFQDPKNTFNNQLQAIHKEERSSRSIIQLATKKLASYLATSDYSCHHKENWLLPDKGTAETDQV